MGNWPMTRALGLLYLFLSAVTITAILCLWALWGLRSLRTRVRRWRCGRMLKESR